MCMIGITFFPRRNYRQFDIERMSTTPSPDVFNPTQSQRYMASQYFEYAAG